MICIEKKNERRIVMIDWKNNLEILMPKLTEGEHFPKMKKNN